MSTEQTTKIVKEKKPTLPAKLSKFLSFGYWFVNECESLTPEVRDALFAKMKLFDGVDVQTEFYESFMDQCSASTKMMKKAIVAHHKPPKAPKAKKAGKKNAKSSDDLIAQLVSAAMADTSEPSEAPVETKPKAKRGKKAPVVESAPTETVAPTEPVAVESEKKPRKTNKKKSAEPVSEPAAEPVVATEPVVETEKKPKKKAAKSKVAKTELPPLGVIETVVDDDEIQTRVVTINGDQKYLIDSDNRLYDMVSHEPRGYFDPKLLVANLDEEEVGF
jgi:hypothetical protein